MVAFFTDSSNALQATGVESVAIRALNPINPCYNLLGFARDAAASPTLFHTQIDRKPSQKTWMRFRPSSSSSSAVAVLMRRNGLI